MTSQFRFSIPSIFFTLAAVCLIVGHAGCGSSKPEKNGGTNESTTSGKTDSAPSGKTKNGERTAPKKTDGNGADVAVRAVINSFVKRNPQGLWDFLPASYQGDVNDLVHEFATLMEPELWNQTFATISRAIKLGRHRKNEILRLPVWKQVKNTNRETIAQEYESTLSLLEILVSSELSDLEKMKTLDVGKFLNTTGKGFLDKTAAISRLLPQDVLQQELNQLETMQVELVSQNENEAVVRLSFKDNPDEFRDVPFVKVEGKWFPKSRAENWKAGVASFRDDLRKKLAPQLLAERKQVVMKQLAILNRSLDDLEKTKPGDDFQNAFQASPWQAILVAMFRSQDKSTAGKSVLPQRVENRVPNEKTGTVFVVIQKRLDNATAQKIADLLFNLDGNFDVGDYSVKENYTQFPVYGVKNFDQFRKKIKFANVRSANPSLRRIVLELKPSP